MSANRHHLLTIAEIIEETADAKSLVFEIPEELSEQFDYRPGQFLTLRVPCEERELPRCYSLCSTPGVDAAPRVTVKRVEEGRASNWICDRLKPGDTLEVLPPAGVFTPKSLDGEFLLIAGGSGITPVFSILKAVLKQGQGRVHLLYANRDEGAIIFRDELKALIDAYPERLTVYHWLDSVQGQASVAQLTALLRPWRSAELECFICGPAPFMESAAAALEQLEVPRERIHIERFISLEDEADAPVSAEDAAAASSVALEVQLDDEVHQLQGSTVETVLETMLNAGLDAPYSCRSGGCAACMCMVQEGEVQMRKNDVLDASEVEAGWVLGCQAVPVGGKLKVSFDDY